MNLTIISSVRNVLRTYKKTLGVVSRPKFLCVEIAALQLRFPFDIVL